MILETPKLFVENGFTDAKYSNFKWTKSIENAIDEKGSEKIFKLCIQMNQKAVLGLMTAVSEWAVWHLIDERLKQSPEKKREDFFYYLQSCWISIVDKLYSEGIALETSYPDKKIEKIFYYITIYLEDTRNSYIYGHYSIYDRVDKLVMLVRHVLPTEFQLVFDKWFTQIVKKSTQLFPATYNLYEKVNDEPDYDASKELFVPRDFYFDNDFDYTITNLVEIQQNLLNQVDCEKNLFVNIPEDMINEGFVGTPYKL